MRQISALLNFFSQKVRFLFSPEGKIYGVGHPYYYYREGDHIAKIEVEATLGDARGDFVIYAYSPMRWMSPYEQEVIPDDKRHLILGKMEESFQREWTSYYIIQIVDGVIKS